MNSVHARDVGSKSLDATAGAGRSLASRVSMRCVLPAILFGSALAVRLTPWTDVYPVEGVRPYGGDAFYHLRRMRHAIENFPTFLDFDPLMNFPHGAQPIWPPTFDWLVAMAFRIVLGPGQTETFERVVMWLPAVLGAWTVIAVYFLGRRFFSPGIGLGAAALLAVLPAHFQFSQLGFVDHHAAVSLVSVAIVWSAMALFASDSAAPSRSFGWPVFIERAGPSSIALGGAVGIALLIWPGCLIHAVVVQLALLGRLLGAADRESALVWARRFAFSQLVTLGVVLPLSVGNEWARWGNFSPVVLSAFQPIYFASATVVVAVSAMIWSRWARCVDAGPRFVVALSTAALLMAALFGSIPELRSGPLEAWDWFFRDEAFQAVVAESVPLFDARFGFDPDRPTQLFGYFVYLVVPALLWSAWRNASRADLHFLLWWTLAFFLATLSQRRFMNTWSIAYALLFAESIGALWQGWPRSWARPRGGPIGRAVGVGGLVLILVAPLPFQYRAHVANLVRAARGEAVEPGPAASLLETRLNVARWLRRHSPDPDASGYSVLAPWDAGHVLKYVAERGVVQDNFGDDVAPENFELAERYFTSTDEQEALDLLARSRTRYVMVQRAGSGHGAEYGPASMRSRLMVGKGSAGQVKAVESGERIPIDALHRHRLVYVSPIPDDATARAKKVSFTGLYEIVPGALVVGQADPGRSVVIRLKLRVRNGEPFTYRSDTVADAQGQYAIRVPYSNEAMGSDVRSGAVYHATSGNMMLPFVVPEASVRDGLVVEGPDFASN